MFLQFNLFNYTIEPYYILNFLSIFLTVLLGVRWNYLHGIKYPMGLGMLFLTAPLAFLLGRVFFFLLLANPDSRSYFFDLSRGGYMALGTIFGGILGALVYFEFKKIPKIEGLEIFIPYIPIGGVFSRLGCFCAGCCYGTVTNSIFSLRFPMGSPAWIEHVHQGLISPDQFFSLPVHPTQLYEIGMWIIAGIILITIHNRKPRKGTTTLSFIVLCFLIRFVEDFVRADYKKILWNLDLMQLLALFIVPLSLLGIILLYCDKLLPLPLRENENINSQTTENE